jgi:CubicO group peptidase (beta-lactamase class C family)
MDQDYIHSIEQKVFDFFPEYTDLIAGSSEKSNLTLRHLLTMTSGIRWDDETYPYSDTRNDLHQAFISNDPIHYMLSKPIEVQPGTVFQYRNCNTNILGEIIRRATEVRIDQYSKDNLFDKLGIIDFEWQMLSNNVVFTSGDLRLRPRDMAKFGYLFLNRGIWKNQQIISQDWIENSTQQHIDLNTTSNRVDWTDGYGYQWWHWKSVNGTEFNAYFASGWGGQWIIVSPSYNMVIISTAGNYYTNTKITIQQLIANYIIPSMNQK